MRLVALETSTPRLSVALIEAGQVVLSRSEDALDRHAERTLPLLEALLSEAGWSRASLERVAAGIGPGGFTGIRIGLALATGLTLALGIEGVGVGSLRALAAEAPKDDPRLRVAARDARREELFVAAYDRGGAELLAPRALAIRGASDELRTLLPGRELLVVGDELPGLPSAPPSCGRVPDAAALGLLAEGLDPTRAPLAPLYVRGAGAERPKLPASPLSLPRS
jgi:tRNA threonylcarbamoyladenosine biosynthesis protein TsaB